LNSIRRRAAPSGVSLSVDDVAIVKGMLIRGDRQHDIAAYFGVNPGRIADVACGRKFADVTAASERMLPAQGPYVVRKLVRLNDQGAAQH
jgi:hypothetical protein